MKWKINEINKVGMQLILPLFEGVSKAPNNSLNGMDRKQRSLIRAAISSRTLKVKGQRLSVWTEGCRVLLVGMGKKEKITGKLIRNTGAKNHWNIIKEKKE